MSQVTIQGNASGTGTITIAAPNTNTDRTSTLPDATGTLLNSDDSRLSNSRTCNNSFDTPSTARTNLGLGNLATLSLSSDNSWTGSQRSPLVTDNDGSFDMNGGNNFKCTPSGNFTLTFTNITNGQSGFILLVNTGGHTISAHTNSKVDANLLPTITAAAESPRA